MAGVPRSQQTSLTVPRRSASLGGELWGIAAYFNPAGYANKLPHLKLFSERVRAQGLKLLIIEAAFDDQPFAVDESCADRVVQARATAVLWQKERLLNIALQHLPHDCDKVAWLDGDILLADDHWVAKTAELLDQFVVVQPFERACWLPPKIHQVSAGRLADTFQLVRHSLAYTQAQPVDRFLPSGHTGFAWAARRQLLQTHGFYDRLILGGGDLAMSWGMYGAGFRWPIPNWLTEICNKAQVNHLQDWQQAFHADVAGSVFYIPGDLLHLWHGTNEDRKYLVRTEIVRKANFDPLTDISLDQNQCWQWSSEKLELHRAVREYFRSRKEDHETVRP
jgi:hypothetical protein